MFLYRYRLFRAGWAAYFGATCLMFSGCTQAPPDDSFDGETLYRGIFQGRGPVASLIPEIRDNYALELMVAEGDVRKEVETFQDSIVDLLGDMDPDFFKNFELAMESGDHQVIQAGLKSAAESTAQAIASTDIGAETLQSVTQDMMLADQLFQDVETFVGEDQVNRSEVDVVIASLAGSDPRQSAQGVAIALETFIVAIVAVAVVVAVLLVVVLAKDLDDPRITIPAGLPQLQQEALVDSIARLLSTA